MVATIQQIIGKVNPLLYAENGKELLEEYGSAEEIPAEDVKPQAIQYMTVPGGFKLVKEGLKAEHTLIYDSAAETLEPVYFWITDFMNDMGLKPEKLIDNFASSPGSGHFGELGQRATVMQQQGQKILGDVNTVLRSVLNIIYDLKEFKIRLEHYDGLKSSDSSEKDTAILALKQLWMDKVDMTKGNSSIKAMALGQAGFQTLIDAFLAAKDIKDVEDLDLNDRVKRILKPRIQEFYIWVDQSEKELRKRYGLERTYLRSQVNSLKLYSRWAKPYLIMAQQLEMKEMGREPAFVKAFNTILLELTLLGKMKLDVKDAAISGELPAEFAKDNFLRRIIKRDYYSCILVDFKFRGIPQKVNPYQSHYTFGGRVDVTFIAYALNEDELKAIDKELGASDVGDVLRLIEGATEESMKQMQEDIEFFLEETSKQEEKEKISDESNPFLALIGHYNKPKEKKKDKEGEKKKEKVWPITKDNWTEKNHIRHLAGANAVDKVFTIFDVYKKAHQMASYT